MVLIAAGQLSSTASLSTNLRLVIQLIDKAVKRNARVLFLPEASDYISRNAKHSIAICKSRTESVFVQGISKKLETLHKSGVYLDVVVGIHEPAWTKNTESETKRVKNTLIYMNSQGQITQEYQKIHLFDINIANGPILQESRSVEPGNSVTPPFDTPCGKLGLGICYDIRFPELAVKLRDQGAQVLTFPSAFTVKTGAAHWKLLGRARAVDTQSYVVMAAQKGVHKVDIEDDAAGNVVTLETSAEGGSGQKRVSYGHTMIIDPWGSVVAEASDVSLHNSDVDLVVADVDLDIVEKVRRDMPLVEHRRRDIFHN